MCRLLGYLGESLSLGALVDAPPHGLLRQSWAAREMQAVVNADGWGAGFYQAGDEAPCLYVCTGPIWSDPNRTHLGRAIRSSAILAAVRSATDPSTVSAANTQPFAAGRLCFLHNGYIEHFRDRVMRKLRDGLSEGAQARIRGNTDSEHIFALLQDELSARGPGALLAATAAAVRRATALAGEADARAYFAIIVTDGERMLGVRSASHGDPPSLYALPAPSVSFPGALLASEPLDESPGWRKVQPEHAVLVEAGTLREVPLP